MTLCGPAVLDIVQHFVERWNEVKKRKVLLPNVSFHGQTTHSKLTVQE